MRGQGGGRENERAGEEGEGMRRQGRREIRDINTRE